MTGYRIDGELAALGEHVRSWRMVPGLTARQLSERAGISRSTLHKLEQGDSGVSLGSVAQVLRALGVLDQAVDALDPLRTDIGRLRAGAITRKRARADACSPSPRRSRLPARRQRRLAPGSSPLPLHRDGGVPRRAVDGSAAYRPSRTAPCCR